MPSAVGIIADSYKAPTGGGWTPATLSGLTGWWDATDAATFTFSAGTTVSAWRDKSGLANHFDSVQATAPERNITVNGLTAVAFGGLGGLRMSTATELWSPTTGACTIIVVMRRDSATAVRGVIAHTVTTLQAGLFVTTAARMDVRPGPVQNTSAAFTLGVPFAAAGIYTGYTGTAGTVDARLNNVSTGTSVGPVATSLGAVAMQLFHNGTNYMAGAVCEAFTYNRALTEPELTAAHTYLTRWGV